MASKTAEAIKRAAIEQERDEQIKRMSAEMQALSAKLETLAQDVARLVGLLSNVPQNGTAQSANATQASDAQTRQGRKST